MNLIRISLAAMMLSAAAPAQQPAAGAAPQTVIKGSTDEVVLDVVVRDKKGKEISDLGAEDFEVTDDGAKQSIKSFRRVEGKEAISKGGATTLDPLRQIRLVTLVFEGLSPEARRFSRTAALDLLKGAQAQNVFYAVMTIDTQLNAIQQFTADKDKLRRAVDRATGGSFTEFAADSARIREELQRQLAQAPDGRGVTQQVRDAVDAANPQTNAGGFTQARMAQVMLDMLQFTQAISREEGARSSIYSMLKMIKGQVSLPGRKTIIYFSEGLRVPTNLDGPFESVIGSANRANVSFYCVDARGVGGAGTGGARGALAGASQSIKSDLGNLGGAAVSRDQVQAADNIEEGMRGDTQAKLLELAESTGGSLLANTNDLRTPLHRLYEEINGYYEITYNPGIENYDGRFRKIGVKASRSDVKVFARSGYFALPVLAAGAATLMPYEVPLLKAVGTSPLPKDVEFRAAVLRFDQGKDAMKGALVIDVPFKSLVFTENKQKGTFALHVSLLALLKNAKGEVLRKFDRDLPLEYPLEKAAEAKQANFQYNEQFSVPPGRYTVEVAVMDRDGGKIGARRVSLVVPAKPSGVGISSLSVVRRFEPKAKGLEPDEPFQYQGGRITPTLAGSIVAVKGGILSIFFVVYEDLSIVDKPLAAVEFLQDGKQVGRLAVSLPAADPGGRIPYVLSAPADAMKPGTYEVHAVVKQGATAAEERTFVTVEPPAQP